jgi:drug/metabolite transporter (DMT)-like permease
MPGTSSTTHASRRYGGAFLLPYAALFLAGGVADLGAATGARMFAVAVTGSAAGALWQYLHRRDLVDRLTHFAAAFTVTAAFIFVLAWNDPLSGSFALGVCAAAILTGCVYCEQWQRGRDARTTRPSRAASAASGGLRQA